MIKIYKYGEVAPDEVFDRKNISASVEGTVKEIIENVVENGDRALFEYSKRFDRADLLTLEVSEQEIFEAVNSVDGEFIEIIKEAAENIRAFHK